MTTKTYEVAVNSLSYKVKASSISTAISRCVKAYLWSRKEKGLKPSSTKALKVYAIEEGLQ